MSNRNKRLKSVVMACVIAIFILLGCMFCVSWAAAVLAQQTEVDGSAMTSKGTSNIVSTAEAKESMPAAFASLLSRDQLARVKELTLVKLSQLVVAENTTAYLSNITNATEAAEAAELAMIDSSSSSEDSGEDSDGLTTVGCTSCPKALVAQVKLVQSYNDTYVKFLCEGGITVAMDHGEIQVSGLPDFPADSTFVACGSASCSSINIEGADVPAMKVRASELNFVDTAGARRGYKYYRGCKVLKSTLYGGGHASSFGGCKSDSGGPGDKIALKSNNPNFPLTVQYRFFAWGPLGSWARWAYSLHGSNSKKYINLPDGCALQYGSTKVAFQMGGGTMAQKYVFFPKYTKKGYLNGAEMSYGYHSFQEQLPNGETHQVDIRLYSTSLHVEVSDQGGSLVASLSCGSYYNKLYIQASQSGNVEGLAGTGEAGQEWTLGPSPSFSQSGKPVSDMMGQCLTRQPYFDKYSIFNGNSVDKPMTKWSDSWMVDATSSLFTYGSGQWSYGWWISARTV